MGKRIIQRARGKGGPPYKSPSHRFPGKIKYNFEKARVVDIIHDRSRDAPLAKIQFGDAFNKFQIGNKILSYLHNFLNGVTLEDPLTGLRVVRWEILKGWNPKSKGFGIEVELSHFVKKNGFNIIEIPIDYRTRIGKKKLGIRHGLTILKRIFLQI